MREIEFEMLHNRRRGRRPVRIVRYERGDVANTLVEHTFRGRAWSWNDYGWIHPYEPRYRAIGGGEMQNESWAYAIEFQNGTRGVCRVSDINRALADLGARIDRRGDEMDRY